jgi:hypothetical protein
MRRSWAWSDIAIDSWWTLRTGVLGLDRGDISDFSEGLSADRGVMLLPIRQACDENKDSAGGMIE